MSDRREYFLVVLTEVNGSSKIIAWTESRNSSFDKVANRFGMKVSGRYARMRKIVEFRSDRIRVTDNGQLHLTHANQKPSNASLPKVENFQGLIEALGQRVIIAGQRRMH